MKRGFRPLGPCGDDPPGSAPGARAVLHFGEHPALPPGRLEATLGPLARHLDLAFEHRIAGQPHDVPYPMALAPIEHPMPAERRVPPQHDAHPRPRLAKTLDQQRQYRPRVPRRIDVRRAKVRDQELAAAKRIQRQKAVPVVVPVEEAPVLMAVHRVVGRVEVNHQLARRAPVRGDELLHQDLVNRHRPLPLGPALEPAQRRGAGQRRVSLTRRLHHLIVAKRIVVVQIFVPRRHRVHPLAHHRHHFVVNLPALALVTERTRHLRGQAQFAVHLAQ